MRKIKNIYVISSGSSREKSFNSFKVRFLPSVEMTNRYSLNILSGIHFALFILLLLIFPVFIIGCRCGVEQETNIPANIVKKSNQQIISKTGEDFFHNYFSLNIADSKEVDSKYLMKYNFKIDGKPFVDKEISFVVDSLGNLADGQKLSGIPNCVNNACDYSVDETKAKQIADEQGLEKGIKNWKSDFVWNDKYENYVWEIISTSSESQGSNGYRGSGNEMIIDANNGKILESNSWHVR